MCIKIIKQGVLTTVQDLGRTGFRSAGIGTGGAMDAFAASVSNYLVGNDDSVAVMEINYPAPEIVFNKDALISLTGADFSAVAGNLPMSLWTPCFIKKGSVLKFNKPVSGSKAYLAVPGGWQAESWLGSYSTNLQVQAGGHSGKSLQKGDELLFQNSVLRIDKKPVWNISQFELDKIYKPLNLIRCIKSVEWNLMDEAAKNIFTKKYFTVSNQSDRMGCRLTGEKLSLEKPSELISSATDAGTIQLLPDGNLIVLMADHQTTGGYPRIGSVIKADLPKFSQLIPGQQIKFQVVDLEVAEEELISINSLLKEIKYGCHFNFKRYFNLD